MHELRSFTHRQTRRSLALVAAIALSVAFVGCDIDSATSQVETSKAAGVVTISAEEGLDMVGGGLQQPGNFGNSDLYATSNGTALKLSPGGSNIVKTRVVTWFQTSGGVFPTYENINQVPNVKPTDGSLSLPRATTGNGFVLENSAGTFTKGYIVSASDTSVTIQFEPLP